MDNLPRYTLRIPQELLDKLGYIAEYEGRTKNREIEQLIKKRIAEFEATHIVPPQMICFPSFEKKSDIILFASSRLDGGPKRIFIGSLFRILTTQAVVSSPGL